MALASSRCRIANARALPAVLKHCAHLRGQQPEVAVGTLKMFEQSSQSGSHERAELTLQAKAHLQITGL